MRIEDKLSFFRNCIIDEVDSEIREQREKLLQEAADKLRLYQAKAVKKNNAMIESENRFTLETKRQMYSRAHIKKTEELLKHKNSIMNDIIAELKLKLADFAGSDEYIHFINGKIDELLPEIKDLKSIKISFLKDTFDRDKSCFYPRFSDIDAEITVSTFNRDKLGGIIVVDNDHQILYDLSLKAVLDSSIDDIGMIIYEEFDRQVNYES